MVSVDEALSVLRRVSHLRLKKREEEGEGGSSLKSPNAHCDKSAGLDHGFDFNDFNDNVIQNNN